MRVPIEKWIRATVVAAPAESGLRGEDGDIPLTVNRVRLAGDLSANPQRDLPAGRLNQAANLTIKRPRN
jgi:hypothetical protein